MSSLIKLLHVCQLRSVAWQSESMTQRLVFDRKHSVTNSSAAQQLPLSSALQHNHAEWHTRLDDVPNAQHP